MALYGVQTTISYVAWDTSANAGKTGDAGNHTLRWVKDGTPAAPSNSPAEVDASNAPGVYKLTLTAAECQAVYGTLAGKSSTSNVSIMPVSIAFEQSGDSYAIVNNEDYGNVALEQLVDQLEERLTAARAGYLDKLNVPGTLAHSDDADTYKADVSAVALSAAERNAVADAVLTRDMSHVEAAAPEHSLCTVVLATLESSVGAGTWTIKRTDGSTVHATKTVTTDPAAEPITGVS